MVSNRMFLFYVCIPYPLYQIIYLRYKALINVDSSEKSTKSSNKHCNSKRFCILQNVLQTVTFFLHKFISK